jgi:predicted dehydrogenase
VVDHQGLEAAYGITVFDDLEQALAWGPDLAFICNPNSLHLPAALAAARSGCHLLIEKPLSHDLAGTDQLAAIMESQGKIGLVAYQMRFHPLLRTAREIVGDAGIGRVLSARAERGEYMPGWHPYEDYRESYAARRDQGGGALLSQIHELDYLYWLFGLPSRLFAVGGHLTALEIDVDDVASVLMACRVDGRDIPVEVHLDYVQRPPTQTLRIIGEQGSLHVDFPSGSLVHVREGQVHRRVDLPDFQRNQLFLDELKHFLACIEGDEQPVVSIRDGIQSLKMALAAQESLQTGQTVHLA